MSNPAEQHEQAEMQRLKDVTLVIAPPGVGGRIARLIDDVAALRRSHQADADQRCLLCRPRGRRALLRRRQPCTVATMLDRDRPEGSVVSWDGR